MRQQGSLSVQDLARHIGRMTATTPVILQTPLRYRNLQGLKIQALRRSQSYENTVNLDQDALRELNWWVVSMASQNGRNILTQEPDLMMKSDASLLGWGAECNGIRTSGLWSPAERLAHINCLELTAAMFAVMALSRNKDSAHIYLKLGNRTTVSYINHMRGLILLS